jgi:hypothetical protein
VSVVIAFRFPEFVDVLRDHGLSNGQPTIVWRKLDIGIHAIPGRSESIVRYSNNGGWDLAQGHSFRVLADLFTLWANLQVR